MDADTSKDEVFRRMFETHYPRVVRYASGLLSDGAAAEDVASEVFHVAWVKLDPTTPFGLPWLMRTAMHKCRDVQRSRYRGNAALAALAQLRESHADGPAPIEKLALFEALAKLSPRERQVLELTYWGDLSAGEVAEVLRVKQGAVWTRLHRARTRLRELLGDGGDAR